MTSIICLRVFPSAGIASAPVALSRVKSVLCRRPHNVYTFSRNVVLRADDLYRFGFPRPRRKADSVNSFWQPSAHQDCISRIFTTHTYIAPSTIRTPDYPSSSTLRTMSELRKAILTQDAPAPLPVLCACKSRITLTGSLSERILYCL